MESVIDSIASIYSNKLEEDTRTPSFTFSVPGIDGSFGILGSGTPLPFWIQFATVSISLCK